jgi:undecaprenyl-diphosphatase
MGYAEAVALGLLQALTEFLPVSSSGHLVLAQQLLGGVGETDLLYDVMLHLATTLAIIAYFRHDLATLLRGALRPGGVGSGPFAGRERRIIGFILLASLPTAILGLVIKRTLIETVTRPDVVGAMLLATGTLLWVARGRGGRRGAREMRPSDALAIGTVQGLAVLPGVSRSGSTITAGVLLGLDRELAARFSFIIAIPAVLGAAGLEALDALSGTLPPLGPFVAGMAVAAVAGYLSIGLILWMVRRDRLHLFALYLWPLGAVAILWYHFA